MTVSDDILSLAAGIAGGAPAPPVTPALRRDVGRLLETARAPLASLDAVLTGPHADVALRWLEETGALGVWLPEVQALIGFHESSPTHHKDLWAHTVEVVGRTPADADLRWVALLHDIGKVATRAIDERGLVTFYGHERLGAWLVAGIAARLQMPEGRAARIAFIVHHHARVNAYEHSWTDRAVRRLIRDSGEHLDDMVRFSSADYTTRRRQRVSQIRAQLSHLEARISQIKVTDSAPPALPAGLGHALCQGLAVRPGPRVGEAIAWLKAEIAAGRLEPGMTTDTYVDACRTHAEPGD